MPLPSEAAWCVSYAWPPSPIVLLTTQGSSSPAQLQIGPQTLRAVSHSSMPSTSNCREWPCSELLRAVDEDLGLALGESSQCARLEALHQGAWLPRP